MPNLFLEPVLDGDGNVLEDPAADIAAFLVGEGPKEWPEPEYDEKAVYDLAKLYLSGKLLTDAQFKIFIETKLFPLSRNDVKGDEIELVYEGEGTPDESQFNAMMMNYLGRRSVSRYGCYGCHDINGFGTSKPIGTALQDWGRKDPSRLALEHVAEFLHHHGEKDGSSTASFVADALRNENADAFDNEEDRKEALRTSFFYDSLMHHGRPGFIFQKLRHPRSYDYEKTQSKTYVERLVMPKFPLTDENIESIATFVLGLVAEPPASQYVYTPERRSEDRDQGEILLRKYNCISCHMTDMHEIEVAVAEGDQAGEPADAEELSKFHGFALEKLLEIRPPSQAWTGRSHEVVVEGEDNEILPTAKFRGMLMVTPENYALYDEEDPDSWQYTLTTWEPASLTKPGSKEDGGVKLPSSLVMTLQSHLVNLKRARTGGFAEWLVRRSMGDVFDPTRFDAAWQNGPPPLFGEGVKVQTEWLYRFLREPDQIRFLKTGLRMPKFNMSSDEARVLANYFAAVDGAIYPYEAIPQSDQGYLAEMQELFRKNHAERAAEHSYLQESWQMLTTTLCIKCHAVGGREFIAAPGAKDVTHAPNLERVNSRLRSDWLSVWLGSPKWLTPYTVMPTPFPKGKAGYAPLFGEDAESQTIGVRDALMNYYRLLEKNTEPLPPLPAPAAAAAEQASLN